MDQDAVLVGGDSRILDFLVALPFGRGKLQVIILPLARFFARVLVRLLGLVLCAAIVGLLLWSVCIEYPGFVASVS